MELSGLICRIAEETGLSEDDVARVLDSLFWELNTLLRARLHTPSRPGIASEDVETMKAEMQHRVAELKNRMREREDDFFKVAERVRTYDKPQSEHETHRECGGTHGPGGGGEDPHTKDIEKDV